MSGDTSLNTSNRNIQLGVSPLSWVNEVLEELGKNTDAQTVLIDAAAAGYAGVENSRVFPDNTNDLNALLGNHGLSFVTGWYSGFLAERDVANEQLAAKDFATFLRDANSTIMVYGECGHMTGDALDVPLKQRLQLNKTDIADYGKRLTQFADTLQSEYGLTLAYHHHLMMVTETLDEVRALMQATGPSVGLLLDTGHAHSADFQYTELLEEFGDRIAHIHLKDVRTDVMKRVREQDMSFNEGVLAGMFTVPGDGDIDFAPLAKWLSTGNYRGWLVVEAEQDPNMAPPAATVTRAFEYVTQHILPTQR